MKDQVDLFADLSRSFATKKEYEQTLMDHMAWTRGKFLDRIHGRVDLPYTELQRLVKIFGLGCDDLFRSSDLQAHFRYIYLRTAEPADYRRYLDDLADEVECCAENPDCRLTQVANDIPFFHFLPFPELTYFKLYAHTYEVCKFVAGCSFELSYEEFVDSLEPFGLPDLFGRIYSAYGRIDSVEVWDDSILDNLLKQLDYMQELKRFSDSRSLDILLVQFEQMLTAYRTMVENVQKDGGARFEFFRCDAMNRMAYISVENGDQRNLYIKLNTINSIVTSSTVLWNEAAQWFKVTRDISLALGMGAGLKRTRYFNGLFAKLRATSERLQQAVHRG